MYYRENKSTLAQAYAQSQTSCCIIPLSTTIRASDLEQGISTALLKQDGMRRDVLQQDEIEGSIKLVRKPEVASCCIAICQYYEAGGSWQTLELCCDITQA